MAATTEENANKEENQATNNEDNTGTENGTNDKSKSKESSPPKKKAEDVDNNKNIHVPKDKKLKIEYVSVKDVKIHNDTVFYEIHVKTLQHKWNVTKRYSQFEDLHTQLLHLSNQKLPLLPGKHYKIFTDHTSNAFIEKRRALLDNYVKKLIKTRGVNSSQCVVNFFHNDDKSKIDEIIESEKQKEKEKEDKNDNDNNNENDPNDEVKIEHRQSDEYEFPTDQEVTNIVIQSTRKMTDHVLYQICVSNSHKRSSFRAWTVLKRFTQFYDMDLKLRNSLKASGPTLLPKLPPAPSRKLKFVHDHMDDDFIEERRVLLENYLSKLLRFTEVVQNEAFLEFLGVDI